MSGSDDEQMLSELVTMSRVYARHGLHERAGQLKQLAQQIKSRMQREHKKNNNNVVDMEVWSEEHADERQRRDG